MPHFLKESRFYTRSSVNDKEHDEVICLISFLSRRIHLEELNPQKVIGTKLSLSRILSFHSVASEHCFMIGTFDLALAAAGQGTGQAAAVERNGVFRKSGGKKSSRSRAAGKFRSAALSMMC